MRGEAPSTFRVITAITIAPTLKSGVYTEPDSVWVCRTGIGTGIETGTHHILSGQEGITPSPPIESERVAAGYGSTLTVPTINGCTLHQYGNEPGWLKVKLNISFCFRIGLSQMPSLLSDTPEVDVCGAASLLVHVTSVPTETVKLSRLKLTMSDARAGAAVEGVRVGVGVGKGVRVEVGTGVRVGVATGVGVDVGTGVRVGVATGVGVGVGTGVRVGVAALAAGKGDWIGRVAVGTGVGEVGSSTTIVGAGRTGAGVGVGGLPVQPESPASRTMLIKTINATIYSSKIIREPEPYSNIPRRMSGIVLGRAWGQDIAIPSATRSTGRASTITM